jgi:hypothetical protein
MLEIPCKPRVEVTQFADVYLKELKRTSGGMVYVTNCRRVGRVVPFKPIRPRGYSIAGSIPALSTKVFS